MQRRSTSEFIFIAIRAGLPVLVCGDRALDLGDDPVAQEVRGDEHLAVAARPRVAGEEVEHVGDVGADLLVAREQAEVGVQARGRGVVVAGPDVDVVAHAVALAADDEHALGVRLERREAVDDVDARLLHRARPLDVRALVEARLELHQADRLLAALGGADQRRHERRVVARAVHGLLDREHVGVVDRLLDEALDRGRERVVGVVDEDVAVAHRARRCRRRSPSSPCRRGWVTGVHGGSRSSLKPGSSTICHRSLRSSRPSTS